MLIYLFTQKTMLTSIKLENPRYTADGYVGFCILYVVFAVSIWFAPSLISILGPKHCMTLGSAFYAVCIASQYIENGYIVYIGFALNGLGASMLWTGQANYIVLNSEIGQVAKEIGLFWMLYQSSFIPGNVFIYFQFRGKQHIDRITRVTILTILVVTSALGTAMLCFLRPPLRTTPELTDVIKTKSNPARELRKSFVIAKSRNLLLLYCTIFYTGLHLTFLSVLSASVGFSRKLYTNSNELVPVAGFCHGIGSIIGGILPQYFSGRNWWYFRPVLVYGILGNIITYIISFVALPNQSPAGYTDNFPLLQLHYSFMLFASFLAGAGDCCLHTELYDMLGALYPNDSAPAFAVMKFLRNIFIAGSFFYSNYFGLHIQLAILVTAAVLSFFTYHILVAINIIKLQKNTSLQNVGTKNVCNP